VLSRSTKSADFIHDMMLRTSWIALAALTISATFFSSPASGDQVLDRALPKSVQIGSGWVAHGPVTTVLTPGSSGNCESGLKAHVAPSDASQLFLNLRTESELRVTLLTAKGANSGSLWKLLAGCGSELSGSMPTQKLRPLHALGISRSESGGWLRLSGTGRDELLVLYVAQISNTVAAYSFIGQETLGSASAAIEHAASAFHHPDT